MKATTVLLSLSALALVACGKTDYSPQVQHRAPQQTLEQQEQSVYSQPQPEQNQQPTQQAQQGFNWGSAAVGAAVGAAAGYALGASNNQQPQTNTHIHRETTYVNRNRDVQQVQPTKPSTPAFVPPAAPKPSVAPAPKPVYVAPKFTPPPSPPSKYNGPSGYSSVRQTNSYFGSSGTKKK